MIHISGRGVRPKLMGGLLSALITVTVVAQSVESAELRGPRPPSSAPSRVFNNPILFDGNDPWVIKREESYFYCGSAKQSIFVGKSDTLQTIGSNTKTVWYPPNGTAYSKEIWAPELHFLDGRWFIYVALDDGRNEDHQMYVLRAKTQNPQGAYELMGALDTGVDRRNGHEKCWAIDGTVLTLDGKLYFIWSGWEGKKNVAQNLYIAAMSNPWTISSPRVLISRPELPWELHGRPLINEGPEVIQHEGKTFVIYSASGSWNDDYCLGQLSLVERNPLEPSSWAKFPKAVFSKTSEVLGPGHASFVNDGKRDWIVYHSAKYPGAGWNREVRMQPFTWNADGSPNFGIPASSWTAIEY